MIGLLGLLIILFLGTLALGYKVCLMASKEKGWLGIVGVIIGLVIVISSIIGGICTTVYLHNILPRMNMMMGASAARPGSPAMMPQRSPMPYPNAPMPPRVAPPAKPSAEEKK